MPFGFSRCPRRNSISGSLAVKAPGFFTTVQDLGRFGYAHLGISASGAADAVALRIGNRLVGNHENAAALEMTLLGGAFEFEARAVVALTGSEFGASLPLWTATRMDAGQVLRCGPARSGARCYLCVRGGIEAPLVFGSASTHALTGIGGIDGRPLKAGDVLRIGDHAVSPPLTRRLEPAPREPEVLRATDGPQAGWFEQGFYGSEYRVSEASNRMGLRLHGPRPRQRHGRQLLTEGVSLGAVQAPLEGDPIILFVEHQTTGGYPKIANVISADLTAVGQLRPRDRVRFERVSLETAWDLLRRQEEFIRSIA